MVVVGSGDKRQSKVIVASLKDSCIEASTNVGTYCIVDCFVLPSEWMLCWNRGSPPGGVTAALPGNNDRAAWIQHFFLSLIMMRKNTNWAFA